MAWRHRRRQPRWADRCFIVVYRIGRFIVTSATMLGFFVSLAVRGPRNPPQVSPVLLLLQGTE